MKTLFAILKNTTFLLILCGTLAVSTATLAMRTASLGTQLAAAGAGAALAQRKAVAAAVTTTKAKARLRRLMVAVPIAGIAAGGYFERQDYKQWQTENPQGTFGDYSCEVATVSAEVVDEVLQELPERVRPSRALILSRLPECENAPE